MGIRRALLTTVLFVSAIAAGAETRSTALLVRVTVVRSCSIDSGISGAQEGSVAITCSRGTTGVLASSTSPSAASGARVVAVRPLQTTTVVPARAAFLQASAPTALRAGIPARQVVTLNF